MAYSGSESGWVEEEVELNRTAAGPTTAGVMRQGALPDSAVFNWLRWLGNRRLCDRKVDICKAKSISMFLQIRVNGRTDRSRGAGHGGHSLTGKGSGCAGPFQANRSHHGGLG